uniref:Uncharacterized protein n=2 Tax=Nicotiana TaxID=4085 RepID=A0A1S4AEA8_TOBAC|nr:PREDICTED: uncharacterized protein LOC104230743 [Nicotiana sylvestris]XP_016474954.1 PREDICTED: uncharacterized protein LOC107796675 [Nicotiana tabacum]
MVSFGHCKDVLSLCSSFFFCLPGFLSQDFDRLKAKLLHYEALSQEARDREKSLKLLCVAKEIELVSLRHEVDHSRAQEALLEKQLMDKADELDQLWGKVGKAKCEFNELQAHVNARSEAKKRAQARASALEAQI